jgi:hypothetical protein
MAVIVIPQRAPARGVPRIIATSARLNYGRLNYERLNVPAGVTIPDDDTTAGVGGLGETTAIVQIGYSMP